MSFDASFDTSFDHGALTMAKANVTVQIGNIVPILVDDIASTAPNTPVDIPVLANDTDPLGRVLHITAVQSPTTLGGTAVILPGNSLIRYTPPPNVAGQADTFTYEANPA